MRFSPLLALCAAQVATAGDLEQNSPGGDGEPDRGMCPPPTRTRTISLPTATISACPPNNSPPQINLICYGDYCAAQTYCEKCERQRVICDGEKCHAETCPEDGDANKLIICNCDDCHYSNCKPDDCNRKVICVDGECAPAQCVGDECRKKFVRHGDRCSFEKCDGEDCYKKYDCDDKECKPEPPCGHNCPVPPPQKPGSDGKGSGKDQGPPGNKHPPPVVVSGSYRTAVGFNLLVVVVGLLGLRVL